MTEEVDMTVLLQIEIDTLCERIGEMEAYEKTLRTKNAELLKSCAEFGHKAGQYDDVVKALQVADGGRYRADTIEALLHRLEQVDELARFITFLREWLRGECSIADADIDLAFKEWKVAEKRFEGREGQNEP